MYDMWIEKIKVLKACKEEKGKHTAIFKGEIIKKLKKWINRNSSWKNKGKKASISEKLLNKAEGLFNDGNEHAKAF